MIKFIIKAIIKDEITKQLDYFRSEMRKDWDQAIIEFNLNLSADREIRKKCQQRIDNHNKLIETWLKIFLMKSGIPENEIPQKAD